MSSPSSPPSDQTLAPGTRLGPYELEGLIGSGGMGHVYRARDPRLGRHVAVKTLPAAMLADEVLARRFESEARTAGALDHPNLLVVYDVGRVGEVAYIVSELLEGETLRERLGRQGALPPRHVAELAREIASGLAAAHARGIVHRDLKPENVFVTRERRVKILDFGIAKRVQVPGAAPGRTAAPSITVTGTIVGTVGYMAPEQLLGEEVDARADVFALGVVLHELLTGALPFQRPSAVATMSAVVNEDPPALPASVPPGLARVVRRCLEKAPEDRFESARDLALALEYAAPTDPAGQAGAERGAAGDRGARGTALSRRAALGYGAATALLGAAALAGGAALRPPAATPSFRRLTFRRGLIRSARAAPDGQTILFGALWDADPCRVYTVRVDGPESHALDLPAANVLAISRAGELAISLGAQRHGVITAGTLARVPLSGGAPRELATGVKFADWSPDGSELAVVRLVDGSDRLEYPLGTVIVRPRAGAPDGIGFARVSPDGGRVAFVQLRNATGSLAGRVCVADRAGTVTPLTPEYLNVHGLAWRGDDILFTASDDRPLYRALRAVPSGGGEARIITRVPGNVTLWDVLPDGRLLIAQTDDRAVLIARRPGEVADRDLSWLDASWVADLSRDGRQILFTETGQGGGGDGVAYLRGSDGAPAVRLSRGLALALSPDGRWALCAPSNAQLLGAAPYLELVPTGAGDTRRIPGAGGLRFTGARWLPDGQRIVVSGVTPGARTRLYRLDLRGGRPVPLTSEGVDRWVLSPDGATIAARGVGPGLTLHPVDGSAGRLVPGTTGAEAPIGWVQEGVLVLGADSAAPTPGDVRVLDPATGRQRPWADIVPEDRAGIMALVSFHATPDGASRAYTWHRALSDLYLAGGLG